MTAAHYLQTLQQSLRPVWRSVGLGTGLMLPLSAGWLAICPIAIAQSTPSLVAQTAVPQGNVVLYVNPVSGNDTTGNGSDRAPFKTITRALETAAPNTTLQMAPGIYTSATGEVFPIALKPRVTLLGNPDTRGQDVVIQGGGGFASPSLSQQNITLLGGANQSAVIGVTVTNPNANGVALQIESSSPTIMANTFVSNGRGGIVVVGNSTSTIRNNFFSQNGESSIWIQGNARPTVQENIMEQSQTGIVVGGTATPLLLGNRITHNKTGIRVEGQAQPKLRGNSVEGNAEFGLQAIAAARPDLTATAEGDANFFRNNGKQDMALPESAKPAAIAVPQPRPEGTPESVEQPAPVAVPAPTPPPVAQEPVAAPPAAKSEPGSVVVPVVTIPVSQSARPEPVTPEPNTPISPSPIPARPAIAPSPQQPQSSQPSNSGLTSSAFPVPAALSNAASSPAPIRPLQVVPVATPAATVPISPAADPALATIIIPATARAAITRPAQPGNLATSPSRPVVVSPRRIPIQPPALKDEIPAPPPVAPRPSPVPQPMPTVGLPVLQTPAAAAAFPVPSGLRPTPVPQAKPVPVPQAIPVPVPQVIPVPVPQAMPVPVARPIMTPSVAPMNRMPQGAIEIPVPRPDSDRPMPPVRAPRAPLSPAALPPIGNNPTPGKPSSLLPVPSGRIPVGNIGDMPKVYTARGGNPQLIPGFPMNPPDTASVVVKYRVVVVATDELQQEQLRAIVPDAFPVVVRGQRVMQAGAFGDRAKADQLVASLSTQGLQAIIEPLE